MNLPVGRDGLGREVVFRSLSRSLLAVMLRFQRVQETHRRDKHAHDGAESPGPDPTDPRARQSMFDVQGDRKERRDDVQPVADQTRPRVADFVKAEPPHEDDPGNQHDQGTDQERQAVSYGRLVGPFPGGGQVSEAEDEHRDHDQEAEQEMQANHQHVEVSLLRNAPVDQVTAVTLAR